jgi:hypothetical protein
LSIESREWEVSWRKVSELRRSEMRRVLRTWLRLSRLFGVVGVKEEELESEEMEKEACGNRVGEAGVGVSAVGV